jgi:DNA mismatch repair protein MutS
MALIKEYFELTKKYQQEYGENTILLMQVGAFFEVYGNYDKTIEMIKDSKIVDFSQICELNIVDKNTCVGKDCTIMMAGFKDFQIEKYIKKIQEAGFTAVVYVQDEATKNTSRSLAGIFSPGTYFHTESTSLTNSIACIWIHLIENKVLLKGKFVVVGVANIDIYTGKTTMFQFKEAYINNPTTYDELERFISIYNPSEVILISNLPDEKEMDFVISYAGINSNLIHKNHIGNVSQTKTELTGENPLNGEEKVNEEKRKSILNCEKQSYQKEILSKFYKFDNFEVFIQNFYENDIATQSLCFLLDFVHQHNPHLVNKISEPEFESNSTRLILANHSLKQLNIINDGTVKASKYSCVSEMLNNCLTPMGKRKFLYNFLNPVFNEEYLQREYDITEYFLSVFDEYNGFYKNTLSTIKDIAKWERQVFLKKISPKAFCNLYNNILTIRKIFDKTIEDVTIINYLKCFEPNILSVGTYCHEILSFIDANIDIVLAKDLDQMQNFEINFIKQGIDQELDKKTDLLKDSELRLEAIQNYLSSLIENKEKKSGKAADYVKIHETEKNNFSLICTSRRCKLLQEALPKDASIVTLYYNLDTNINTNTNNNTNTTNNKKKYEFKISKTQFAFEKQTSSNNSITDEQISGLCKNISSIKVSMKDLITLVFNKFVTNFETFQPQLESIINFITLVDVLYTKAAIAKKHNYCKPTIVKSDKSFVDAKQLRHCLIEQFQTNELYVTNDIILGEGSTDGILLYGTNAVGKTSFIRALGVAIIMAQSGLYVPCSEFNYMPYKYLFTRIIGNDNIFKGLSTFAVEMSELRTILRLSDENSLILGDELCSGTETLSAISIFVAGIQQLHRCKSSFIFATHLHEIVDYSEISELPSVKLKHMEVIYDKERDVLVYDRKLRDGPGNSMYGLEVCKSLSLPGDFLDAAYEIRMKYHPESKSILSLKTSHYNSKKIVGMCEKCGKRKGTEVHHLQHQRDANDNGIIINSDGVFHKNNLANLMTLCEECHNETHHTVKKGEKRVKTSKGSMVKQL